MKTKSTHVLMQNKNIFLIALATALLLLVPLVAMQFTNEVNWSPFDFVVAGAMLFGAGLAYELLARKSSLIAYRAAAGAAVLTALLLLWINFAVGILGPEDNPFNWMYVGVLAVLLIGAIIARFRPLGIARALYATALAQAVATAVALIAGQGLPVIQTLLLNGFFIALWIGSALLFLRAKIGER